MLAPGLATTFLQRAHGTRVCMGVGGTRGRCCLSSVRTQCHLAPMAQCPPPPTLGALPPVHPSPHTPLLPTGSHPSRAFDARPQCQGPSAPCPQSGSHAGRHLTFSRPLLPSAAVLENNKLSVDTVILESFLLKYLLSSNSEPNHSQLHCVGCVCRRPAGRQASDRVGWTRVRQGLARNDRGHRVANTQADPRRPRSPHTVSVGILTWGGDQAPSLPTNLSEQNVRGNHFSNPDQSAQASSRPRRPATLTFARRPRTRSL